MPVRLLQRAGRYMIFVTCTHRPETIENHVLAVLVLQQRTVGTHDMCGIQKSDDVRRRSSKTSVLFSVSTVTVYVQDVLLLPFDLSRQGVGAANDCNISLFTGHSKVGICAHL